MSEQQHAVEGRPWWLILPLALLVVGVVAAIVFQSAPDQSPEVTPQVQVPPAFEDFPRLPVMPEPAVPQVEEPSAEEPALPDVSARPEKGLALIMDDIGYDRQALQRLLDLKIPMAISVLPDAPLARQSALMAHQAGQLVMLHLPMEPENPYLGRHMSDAFLYTGMDEQQLRQVFEADLVHVPFVEGVNNHMGSRLTQQPEPMQWVMDVCREHGLFFVDSRTHKDSVAAQAARDAGIAWASRRLFLDHRTDPDALQAAWDKAVACAEHQRCILIAHPHKETLQFLESVFGEGKTYPMTELKQFLHPAASS